VKNLKDRSPLNWKKSKEKERNRGNEILVTTRLAQLRRGGEHQWGKENHRYKGVGTYRTEADPIN